MSAESIFTPGAWDKLLDWWAQNARKYPWRETRDPYAILIAEVLLHRTRADQVQPLYRELMARYPDVESLTKAPEIALLQILASAGLRWRVHALSRCAKEIQQRFNGEIPSERRDLMSLPGIGHYITAAIRCFAFGYDDAIIDTNTVRVLSRMFAIPVTDRLRRDQAFHQLADALLIRGNARDYNLALLDLAALVCTPRNPRCPECPLQQCCAYPNSGRLLSPQRDLLSRVGLRAS